MQFNLRILIVYEWKILRWPNDLSGWEKLMNEKYSVRWGKWKDSTTELILNQASINNYFE